MADAATAAALADGVARVQPPQAVRDALLARIAVTAAGRHRGVRTGDAQPFAPSHRAGRVCSPRWAGLPGPSPCFRGSLRPRSPAVEPPSQPAPNTEAIQAISRRSWTRGMLGLAASLILLVGLGFGAVSIGQLFNRPAAVVALEQIENAPDAQSASAEVADGGNATVHWSESVGKVVLVSQGASFDRRRRELRALVRPRGRPDVGGHLRGPRRGDRAARRHAWSPVTSSPSRSSSRAGHPPASRPPSRSSRFRPPPEWPGAWNAVAHPGG